jgi:UDP:flavonoid glycosyltransferase YjiC (YdhE family)
MRVLFSCRPLAGHFLPLASLAACAKQRGHTIAFATGEPMASQIRTSGYDCFTAGLSYADSWAQLNDAGIVFRDLAPDQMRPVAFGRWFSVIETPPRLADLDRICTEFRPDLLVHEVAELAAPLAAASAGLPWATVGFGPLLRPDVAVLAGDAVAPLWHQRGLKQRPMAGLYEHLYVDPCPPALQIAEIDFLPARIGLSPGAAQNLTNIERHGAGRIYVTFGTVWNSGPSAVERLRLAIAGSASLGAEVVVTVGKENDPQLLGSMPANVQVHRFIPQDQVLADCACAVIHGGSGTMLGALSWGLPLLMLPQFADQFYNSERAVLAGVALALTPSEISVEAVSACTEKLMGDTAIAACAASVRDELASMPSVEEVMDRIEVLANRMGLP